jgi:predicted anti-sigma-YlaC factor YlaD
MDCHLLKVHYLDYISEQIEPELRMEIEQHLRTCESCRRFVEQEQQLTSLLKSNPIPDPGDSYWSEVENIILTKVAAGDEPDEIFARRSQKPLVIAMKYLIPLAAVIIIMIVSLTLKGPLPVTTESRTVDLTIKYPTPSDDSELLASMILSAPGLSAQNLVTVSHIYDNRNGGR